MWNLLSLIIAREGRKMYVVAPYGPPGNYGFVFSTNVLEPTC